MSVELPTAWRSEDLTVAGIDVGGTQCSVNIGSSRNGRFDLLVREQFPTRSERGPEAVLADIVGRLRKLVATRRPALVGVSCGGPLDAINGVIQGPPNLPGWDDIPITEIVSSSLGVRCVLENDANASAVAEWAFGAGRGVDDLVFLTCGTGLGAGLILDGTPYRGVGDLAGEVGHWRLGPDEGPVHYGKKGSFEGFCSGSGISEWYQYLGGQGDGDGPASAEIIGNRARNGEVLAQRVYDQAAHYLGKGLALVIDALAPALILIGGVYGYAHDLLESGMRSALTADAHPLMSTSCEVLPAGLGSRLGSYASCCVALSAASRPALTNPGGASVAAS